MSGAVWKCAGCGSPEPFYCKCPTEVAYSANGLSARKQDIKQKYRLTTKLRWKLFQAISVLGWKVCPEPHRSNLYASMKFDQAGMEASNDTHS